MQAVAPFQEAVDIIKEEGGEISKLCYQCGLCTGTCPWNLVRSFLVRKAMHQAQLGLPDFEDEDMWLCVTCNACVKRCPRGVEIIDVWRSFRRAITELGIGGIPDSLRITAKNISGVGNPQGEERETRNDWARELGVKTFTEGTEVLYVPCCYNSYDPQLTKVARATAELLKRAEVDFGILGAELSCCGESVRKAGNESLFQSLAQSNIGLFDGAGVTRIVTASPHCFHTYKKEYPELEGKYEVVHTTEYLAELIRDGRLTPTKELGKTVTYHDSCYLGRHNEVYDAPREVLQSIPGLELVEMANFRENSLCCGGGGGRIWEETRKGERFSDIRIDQALAAGASVLAAVCPYCMANFIDSIGTMNKEDEIEVKEIAELVLESL
jgi:Fe-S oxidoreductase